MGIPIDYDANDVNDVNDTNMIENNHDNKIFGFDDTIHHNICKPYEK